MLAAAGMLLAASCTNDELNSVEPGGEATVRFSIGLENGVQTRTISDGKGVDMLVYAVYDKDGNVITSIDGETENIPVELVSTEGNPVFTDLAANVDITLAKGQTYKVVFWAQNSNCTAYSYDEKMNITVDYTTTVTNGEETSTVNAANNDETRDAFYAVETITVDGSGTKKVTLKRPFAQINVGVSSEDWTAAGNLGVEIASSAVTIENAGNSINLLTGKVSGTEEVTFNSAAIPGGDDGETLTVTSDDETTNSYYWLSMSYILVNDGSEDGSTRTTLDKLNFTFDPADEADSDITLELSGVSVQRNYRTNIVGKILTGNVSFTVVLDKTYGNGTDTGEENIELWDGETITEPETSEDGNTIYISTGSELAWLAAQVNSGTTSGTTSITKSGNSISGKTIQLTKDIYLNNQPWTPIGTPTTDITTDYPDCAFVGTFLGDGHTIHNLNVSSSEAAGLFGSVSGETVIQDLTIDGATITSNHWAGVLCGYYYLKDYDGTGMTVSNCHVKNASVTVSAELDNGEYDNGDKAGGLIGYLVSYSTGANVTECSVENTTITAYRDMGGLLGVAFGYQPGGVDALTVTNNTVSNVSLTIDATHNYKEYSQIASYNAGEIIGRNDGSEIDMTSNSSTSVDITMISPDATSLTAALADENISKVVISENVDLSDATEAELTFSTAKTIEIEEGATLQLGSNCLTAEAGLTLTGGGTIETTAEEGAEKTQLTLIKAVSGECVIDGVTLINDTDYHYHGYDTDMSAAIFCDAANLTITNSSISSGMAVIYGTGSAVTYVTIENCTFESTSSQSNGTGNYSYALNLCSSYVSINDCVIKGIQGAIGLANCAVEINGGTYYTVNSVNEDGTENNDAYYAVYANASYVFINDGKFSSAVDRSGGLAEGTSAVISHYGGSLYLYGGQYSGKAYDLDSDTGTITVYETLYEGYEWQAITDDTSGLNLVWEVVASE